MENHNELERIHEKRKEILDYENEIWTTKCRECGKIREAIAEGILPKGTQKDKTNVVCDLCPHQNIFTRAGKQLDVLITDERRLRGGKKWHL